MVPMIQLINYLYESCSLQCVTHREDEEEEIRRRKNKYMLFCFLLL
jgi:hypothetical protein